MQNDTLCIYPCLAVIHFASLLLRYFSLHLTILRFVVSACILPRVLVLTFNPASLQDQKLCKITYYTQTICLKRIVSHIKIYCKNLYKNKIKQSTTTHIVYFSYQLKFKHLSTSIKIRV